MATIMLGRSVTANKPRDTITNSTLAGTEEKDDADMTSSRDFAYEESKGYYSTLMAKSRLAGLRALGKKSDSRDNNSTPSESLSELHSSGNLHMDSEPVFHYENEKERLDSINNIRIESFLPRIEPGTEVAANPRDLKFRRLQMLQQVIIQLQHPITGIQTKDRKKMFRTYPKVFQACDLVDWIWKRCHFLSQEEATHFCQQLHQMALIISVDLVEKFISDHSYYVFQSNLFWPLYFQQLSDFDYGVYLFRRNLRRSSKFYLQEWEEDRLDRLEDAFQWQWNEFEREVKSIEEHLETYTKMEQRLFHLQEYAFWRQARPQIGAQREDQVEEIAKEKMTPEAYEKTLSPADLVMRLEQKVDYLQSSLTMNRLKISQACKALITRTSLLLTLDPLADPTSNLNPFVTDNQALFVTVKRKPRVADIKLWQFSFNELLRDPIGVQYFHDFVQKEFSQENLEFYLKCQALEELSGHKEFTEKAIEIYEEFIAPGAPRELNIVSAQRSAVMNECESSKANATLLNYYVFRDVFKAIVTLMSKDSYVRFCNSELLHEALRGATAREQQSSAGKSKGHS